MKYIVLSILTSTLIFAGCTPEADVPTPNDNNTTSTTWYKDADGDGYGDAANEFTGDRPDPTWVVDSTDCNDDAATGGSIYPGATELNNDHLDSDCDAALSKAPFTVGDVGPAGGIVFQTDGTNGLEAAPEDQNNGIGAEWGCYEQAIEGADSLTNGIQNTADMLAANCSTRVEWTVLAIDLVNAYSLNGYSDWYLPSRDELHTLHSERSIVGGFTEFGYWSSSEKNSAEAWVYYFSGVAPSTTGKTSGLMVRAIRAF